MSGNEMDTLISGMNAKSVQPKAGKGQYFIDQSTGQYYYQAEDGEAMTVVNAPAATAEGELETFNYGSNKTALRC